MRLGDQALRRWAWGIVCFFAAVMVFGSIELWEVDNTGAADRAGSALFALMITLFPVVGLLIIRRQPRNPVGWLLLAIGFAWGMSAATELYVWEALLLHPGSLPGGRAVLAYAAASWLPPIVLMGVYLILLFPDGKLPSPRWRPLAWLAAVVGIVGTLAFVFAPGVIDGEVPVADQENPLGIDALGPALDVAFTVLIALLPVCILASAFALVLRFRRSQGVERLQLKWLATAGTLIAVLFLLGMLGSLPSAAHVEGTQMNALMNAMELVSILSFGLIPLAIGVAVSRHGLYGIDAIISRALVFGALAVFITGVYVAIVVGVGTAIGNQNPSIALSVLATAVVAVAFQPVRERVQHLANRLVYGTRTSPYDVVSDFAARMAGTYTTSELLPQMARMVGQGVGATRIEVWLSSGSALEREACWPEGESPVDPVPIVDGNLTVPGDRVVPVRHQGELLGLISVSKASGEPVTPTDDKMLAAVASQAGLVLRNVRLIDDLRSSRERLVTSQDRERRRLERNLHDGAQQSLVSVTLLTRMAAARASDEHLRASLTEAAAQLGQAIEQLRELARGIHPAILTERGLGPALSSLAERSPVPVRVEYALDRRPPEAIERTLYFVVAEALTNVAKYAAASAVTVTASQAGDEVLIEVHDDGVGGADASRGSGLRGLLDRVAAVDGSLEVDSPLGGGTRVRCRVRVSSSLDRVLEPVS